MEECRYRGVKIVERVYAPLGGDPVNGVSWKELNEAIAKAMQNYCGEQKRDELLLSGVELLARYEKEIVPHAYAANPHELMRLLEVFDILTVAQMILQACLARHQTCPKLETTARPWCPSSASTTMVRRWWPARHPWTTLAVSRRTTKSTTRTTILPTEQAVEQHNRHQLYLAETAIERHRVQQKLAAQAEAPRSPL